MYFTSCSPSQSSSTINNHLWTDTNPDHKYNPPPPCFTYLLTLTCLLKATPTNAMVVCLARFLLSAVVLVATINAIVALPSGLTFTVVTLTNWTINYPSDGMAVMDCNGDNLPDFALTGAEGINDPFSCKSFRNNGGSNPFQTSCTNTRTPRSIVYGDVDDECESFPRSSNPNRV